MHHHLQMAVVAFDPLHRLSDRRFWPFEQLQVTVGAADQGTGSVVAGFLAPGIQQDFAWNSCVKAKEPRRMDDLKQTHADTFFCQSIPGKSLPGARLTNGACHMARPKPHRSTITSYVGAGK